MRTSLHSHTVVKHDDLVAVPYGRKSVSYNNTGDSSVFHGFDKVVFIIRKDIRDAFDKMIGDRISKYVKIDYVSSL